MLAIGLNLSSSRISIIELLKSRNNLIVRKVIRAEVPAKCIVKGEIQDTEGLAGSLKEIWRKNKISDRRVFVGIANQKVIAKEIRIPVINDNEIKNSIQYQINDFIPIPKNNIIYDYYIVEKGDDHSRIMLVGAMKSMIEDVVSGFKKAGLLAQAIDLNCFALYRTVQYIKELEKNKKNEKNDKKAFCVANLGLEISIIEMVQNHNLKYPRFTATSVRSFIDEIYKETKKDNSHCEEILSKFDFKSLTAGKNKKAAKKSGNKNSPDKSREKDEKKPDKNEIEIKDDSGRIEEIIKRTADRFIGEIKLSIEHFLQENPKFDVGKIILTGEYIKNIDKYIEQEISCRVEQLNISDYFSLKYLKAAAGYREDSIYVIDPVALGMALRGLNQ